jgi:hypothetical protein
MYTVSLNESFMSAGGLAGLSGNAAGWRWYGFKDEGYKTLVSVLLLPYVVDFQLYGSCTLGEM